MAAAASEIGNEEEEHQTMTTTTTAEQGESGGGVEVAAEATIDAESGALVMRSASAGGGTAMIDPQLATAIVPSPTGQKFVRITELLTLPQHEAAQKLGIPVATLSKRWKEATRGRRWPHRAVSRIDKEIITLLHNIPEGAPASQQQLPDEIEAALAILMRRRQEELRDTIIRL